ncbi:MAG TPA: amidohydrolase family protein [Burkholderiales bacterium]|jgi:D-galactarolactone isomerase|nr:amidohydrolase family protein [Burkholderiales bacterium]
MPDIQCETRELELACDCHMHIWDPRFPLGPAHTPTRAATVADYLRVRELLGLGRVVVVQSTAYGTDNACTLDAMAQMGDSARGVAVVDPAAPDAELARLTAAGIRGLRYVMFAGRPLGWDSMQLMASRIAPFGWNINLQLRGEELAERAALLAGLACNLVIDHIGRFTAPFDHDTPGVRALYRLLDAGRCWVKLSAPYHGSKSGPPHYADNGVLARELVKRWPERMLFATNWPHPSVKGSPPDDLALMKLLWEWTPDAGARRRILVENPAHLYFDKAPTSV